MNFIEVPFAFIVVRLMMVFFFYICNLFLRVYYSSGYLDIKINCRLKLHAHVQINFITVEILQIETIPVINMKSKFIVIRDFQIYENLFRENLTLLVQSLLLLLFNHHLIC